MNEWLHDLFRDRPVWMNVVMAFCAYMAFVYVPWDLFVKPTEIDREVWFGITFTAGWAKLMAIPHWVVYAGAVYGFRRFRPWMAIAAPLYTAQVAFGMAVWPIAHFGWPFGPFLGLIAAVPFGLLTWAFWESRDHFLKPRPPLADRYGDWALVTGASAGIGEAFVRAIAREGMNVVLSARRRERLEALAEEIERVHGVKTRVVEADLSDPAGADALADAVDDLPLGLLVNNAGFGYAGRFDKQETSRLREMVAVNCLAPTILTSRLLPAMQARRRGGVVFTGSVSGRQPLPLHGVYSATKAFDLMLGESLFVEMRSEGVDVLVLEPGSTVTEFQQVAGEIQHPGENVDDVVAVALDALGRQPSVISGWWNWIRANAAVRLAPRPLVAYVARQVMEVQTPAEMR
jgi:short-subunit dehydrogenase